MLKLLFQYMFSIFRATRLATCVIGMLAGSCSSAVLANPVGSVFGPAMTYAVGINPVGMTVIDLGNGHPDIVVANTGDNTIGVLLGNGDGTFQPQVVYTVPTAGQLDVIFDVTDLGNGHLDIVVNDGTAVSVLLGKGDGTFQPPVNYPLTSGLTNLTVTDLGNGHPDIVGFTNAGVGVLIGNGDGTFQSEVAYADMPGYLNFNPIGVADLGNGHPDMVATEDNNCSPSFTGTPTCTNYVVVFLGKGDGTFQSPSHNQIGGNFVPCIGGFLADLGNGYPSVICESTGFNLNTQSSNPNFATIYTMVGNGDGSFQSPGVPYSETGAADVTVADLGSGHPDLVLIGTTCPYSGTGVCSSGIAVVLGNGDGSFQPPLTNSVNGTPTGYVIADFGNGHPDIAVNGFDISGGSASLNILLGNGDGSFQPSIVLPTIQGTYPAINITEIDAADFNGDGLPDIGLLNAPPNAVGSVVVMLNEGPMASGGGSTASGGGMHSGGVDSLSLLFLAVLAVLKSRGRIGKSCQKSRGAQDKNGDIRTTWFRIRAFL